MTSSARSIIDGGTARPSALAVLRFTAISNFVDEAGDVPTRAVERRDDAAGDGLARARKYNRDRPRLPLEGSGRRGRMTGGLLAMEIRTGEG